jgi:hypothetical protein
MTTSINVYENIALNAYSAADVFYSLWIPWADVEVESWLMPREAWHNHIHSITSPKLLSTIEGEFAPPQMDLAVVKTVR